MIVYFVVDDVPVAPRLNQASVPQQAQLVGHTRLGNAGEVRKVSNTKRSRQQRIKDSHPGRIGKRLECFSDHSKNFGGRKGTSRFVESLRIYRRRSAADVEFHLYYLTPCSDSTPARPRPQVARAGVGVASLAAPRTTFAATATRAHSMPIRSASHPAANQANRMAGRPPSPYLSFSGVVALTSSGFFGAGSVPLGEDRLPIEGGALGSSVRLSGRR